MKALVIGAMGFAGSALTEELKNNGYEVIGTDIVSNGDDVIKADMLNKKEAFDLISKIRPDIVFNLAGQASPLISWKDINLTMHLNVDLSVNIAEAVLEYCPDTKILYIGSANQYDMAAASGADIDESCPLVDNSPYAISKNTQEAILKLLIAKKGLKAVFTRSFNHIGPTQKEGFVVTDYCKRIALLEKGELDTFEYGNLDSWRDFSDVRDVVRAYRLLGEKGQPGEVYNVGSGKSFYIRDMIGTLVEQSAAASDKTKLPVRLDDNQLTHYRADISKLSRDTGFEPEYDINDTLVSVLEAYRNRYV
ncbi:MAG: NAD-dependent epimerase/dehydratase family protein [Saccharofermentans sp.]|nr:NAD-dependent epimerase/dehydratase family protein [Saccharofermentans sp.]